MSKKPITSKKYIELNENIQLMEDMANKTDPKVKFDPEKPNTAIILPWDPESNPNDDESEENQTLLRINKTRDIAITCPLVLLNNTPVGKQELLSVSLDCTGNIPKIRVHVVKTTSLQLDIPGMANILTYKLIPAKDGTYRGISLDFYITNVTYGKNDIIYTAEYASTILRSNINKVYKVDGKNKLTTYELLYTIAKENKLGFSATDQCKEIEDTNIRFAHNQTPLQVINENISFSGLDKNSIFDWWIDVNNHLVMVNIPWIMNNTVEMNDISMKILEGINMQFTEDKQIEFGEKMPRLLTNWKATTILDRNKILAYNHKIDNESARLFGTNNVFYVLNSPIENNENTIESKLVTISDKSPDGQNFSSLYNFRNYKYIGVEMGWKSDGNNPILFQQKLRKAYMLELKSHKLEVELNEVNFALQRGTLVNLNIYEYDRDKKRVMATNIENIGNNPNKNEIAEDLGETEELLKAYIDNEGCGMPDFSLSGMYYIDGIKYIYNAGEKVKEILYLIKKDLYTNYINSSGQVKIKV